MSEQPKAKTKSKQRVEIALKFILVIALLAAGVKLIFFNSSGSDSNDETKHKAAAVSREDFAKCLNEKGLVMYGIDTCPFCQAQKKMFGSAFENISYTNCDFDKDKCDAAGVVGYPMWEIANQRVSGIQNFPKLAALTGCTAPVEDPAI